MKIFGRSISIQSGPQKALKMVSTFFQIMRWSKHPLGVMQAYLKRESPEFVETRDGLRIFLSSNRNDIVTYVVVFCNQDYGNLNGAKTVIDIGANCGIFSAFAISRGAQKVYAFEPNKEAFGTMLHTIQYNNLQGRVFPFNNAVSDTANQLVYIPKKSSPTNVSVKDLNRQDPEQFDAIPTVSINDFFEQKQIEQVDLVKMDCEGAEYYLLPSISAKHIAKIKNIKLEYHHGKEPIIQWLAQHEFTIDFSSVIMPEVGFIWASRL